MLPSLDTAHDCENAICASDRRLQELCAQLDDLERYRENRLVVVDDDRVKMSRAGEQSRCRPEPPRRQAPQPTLVQRSAGSSFGAPSSQPPWQGVDAVLKELTEELARGGSVLPPEGRSKYDAMLDEEKERTRCVGRRCSFPPS